ncbi:MAG: trypsin-like serine peptidase [Stackebrandtia sp.]
MNLRTPRIKAAAVTIAAAGLLVTAGAAAASADQDAQDTPDSSQEVTEPTMLKAGEIVDADFAVSYADSDGTQVVSDPGATYIKVRFASLDLAPGDYVTVSNPDGTEEYTYHGAPGDGLVDGDSGYTVHDDGLFAAMSIEGDTAEVTLHGESDSADASGVTVDAYWRGYDSKQFADANADILSVCGNDARRDVVCYNDETHAAEFSASAAVARQLKDGSGWCTAWRVGNTNRMLTNNHCVSTQADLATVESQFGYECATCDGNDPQDGVKVGSDQLVVTNPDNDFSLYSVQNFEEIEQFGTLYIEEREPNQDERIYIPGHGDAAPKRLSIYTEEDGGEQCKIDTPQNGDVTTGYACDTSGGNSGSPVISGDTNKVLAIHALGGCPDGINSGYRMSLIYPQIADEIDNTEQ